MSILLGFESVPGRDRQTDRQTDRITVAARLAVPAVARKKCYERYLRIASTSTKILVTQSLIASFSQTAPVFLKQPTNLSMISSVLLQVPSMLDPSKRKYEGGGAPSAVGLSRGSDAYAIGLRRRAANRLQ